MRAGTNIYDDAQIGAHVGTSRWTRTGRQSSSSLKEQAYVTNELDRPWDDLGEVEEATKASLSSYLMSWVPQQKEIDENDEDFEYESSYPTSKWKKNKMLFVLFAATIFAAAFSFKPNTTKKENPVDNEAIVRPDFVYEHPYISSSYYTSTKSLKTLQSVDKFQVQPKKEQLAGKKAVGEKDFTRDTQTRLAILRPFCAFDAGPLPTTFDCWQSFPPCKAAAYELGDEFDPDALGLNDENRTFDAVGSHMLKNAKADVFLFYSQTFSENDVAVKSVDTIIDQYFEGGGWAQCFDNIYAVEANIPADLDNYIPPMQEYLYNWVNGPNRQFEAGFRIVQSGEWGDYDGFYLMEGDSIPIKSYWLDVVLSEIEVNRPFAIMGAKYNGDKWDNFYEAIPLALLDHTNGNGIYNTSHPLLDRLVGQLEVEAPCPYNSIPYDFRMSQMWIEGTRQIVPELAPAIMLDDEGKNITLSNNTAMFTKWGDRWAKEHPFKETPVIHNYAATNLIPRHLGPEYIIHGAKLYAPWNPARTEITLVVSEWFFDRSAHLLSHLDEKDHPFSEVVVMLPPNVDAHEDYRNMTSVPTRTQHRDAPDYMDMCEADIKTEWFMLTNSYHHVANHVDLMFTPGKFQPVIPFTPATYPFCFKFPYCKETINLSQRFNADHAKVVLDFDMLYHTETRNSFCKDWKELNGDDGSDLYTYQKNRILRRSKIIGPSGPTGTSYTAYLFQQKKDKMYKLVDRSLYGARAPFIKIFAKEEKLDGMSEEELALKMGDSGMMGMDNQTDCNCFAFETLDTCENSPLGCIWRPLFESCHPPEMIGDSPICPVTTAPTLSPTKSGYMLDTEAPTSSPTKSPVANVVDPWYSSFFLIKERETLTDVEELHDDNLDDDEEL
uniref:Uncharacterized protein n=2 Tax=Chaetoceros debilis TaxID=122233 RepID=A0A7S3V5V7_9STRA|mmetsp:Transcript_13931/g.20254  ORF Transcript_13931/g.20254 Transcript_13931/m.20254 type:complete len:889 (+) Transcript_13931:145-2811(+)